MISKEEVQNLATLARVEVSEVEVESLQKDISNILEYIGQLSPAGSASSADSAASSLQDIRGRSLAAESATRVLHNILRDDTPRKDSDPLWDKRESLLEALPKREGDYNVVRKIIQKDE